MADSGEKIDGLIIPVVVEADEKSPGIALHKLTKEFLSKLKDGYIDVPAKIDFGKADTKELSDKLEEVQDDFAAKWKAIAKKGFFADSDVISKEDKKELDDFINSFKKLQTITGKDKADKRKTAQWQKKAKGGKSGEVGSLKALSETIHKYEIEATREMAQLKAEVAETAKDTEKEIKKANKKKGASTGKKTTSGKGKSGGRRSKKLTASDVQKIWEDRQAKKKETEEQAYQELVNDQEQIDNDIKQKGIGINERKAMIAPMLDKLAIKRTAGAFRGSNLYEHMERRGLNASDWGGGHRSKFAEMQARTEKESQDLAKATDKHYNKGKEYANQKADEAIEKGHGNRRPKQYKQEDDRKALSDAILKNTALVGGQLMGGVEGATADTFKDAVAQAMIDAMANSKFEDIAVVIKSAEDAIKTMTNNRFKSTGRIGVQKGDQPKGEGKNLVEWNSAMKDILQGFASLLSNKEFQSTWTDIRTELTGIIRNIEDQEKANNEAIKNREKMPYKGKGLKGIYNSIKQGFEDLGNKLAGKQTRKERIKAEGERLYGEKDKLAEALVTAKGNLTNSNSYSELYGVIRNSLNPVVQEQKKDTKATETQTTLDKIEDAREGVMDQKEVDVSEENKVADVKTEETVGEDLGTGFNTNAMAKTLIDKLTINSKIADQTQQKLDTVLTVIEGLGSKFADFGKGMTGHTPVDKNAVSGLSAVMCPCQGILENILKETHIISVYADSMAQNIKGMAKEWGVKEQNTLPTIVEGQGVKDKTEKEIDKTNYQKFANEYQSRKVERERAEAIVHNSFDKYREEKAKKQEQDAKQKKLDDMYRNISAQNAKYDTAAQSKVTMSPFQFSDSKIYNAIKKAFGADNTRKNAREISKMTQSEQEKIRAERIAKFGLSRGGRDTDTGDIAQTYRTKRNYGWGGKNIENPFANLNLSEGINIDTTEITEALQNAIQKNMFNAQTGGVLQNVFGAMTGYIGMPSLEKSRAEADAANQIMANIRDTVQDILNDILAKETDLKGMERRGEAKFENGKLVEDNSRNGAATKLFADLEEQKIALRGVLADAAEVDDVVKDTGGNLTKILQQLGFVAPELRKNNKIIQNINAGLDKNGKALKFQTRTAEMLNYTFQLMARHIGQMIKNWIMMLNPINLVKKAFQDFASYDTKWQRTMNVIKYNLRRIIRPAMEWIAQQIVNIIGLVNALLKGIGSVFGQNWDLFDQSAASAEQMREELEKAANVTAGFDELHDIGGESSSNAAEDLMGDIYKPQWDDLYKSIEEFGKKIGNVLKGIQKLTEGWDFWKWLAIAGAALLGLMALKWLINLFSGKNPLKSVADGFSFLEKAVGWALLIWAFTEFTKALTDFVECMKTADWPTVAKSLIMLGGAFAFLVGSIVTLEKFTKKFGTATGQLLGLSALVWVFGEFVKAVIPFIECIKDLVKEFGLGSIGVLGEAILGLVGAFAALVGAIGGLEKFTKVFGTDFAQLFGLSALVYVFGDFVGAVIPFINCIKDLVKEFGLGSIGVLIEAIFGLVGAFGALVVGVYGVEKVTSKIGMFGSELIGLSAVVGALSLFVKAITPFVQVISEIEGDKWDTIVPMVTGLVGAFIALAIGVGTISRAFSTMDWKSILQLYAVAGVFELFMYVMIPFIKLLKDVPFETMAGGMSLLAGTFVSLGIALGIIGKAWKGMNIGAFAELALVIAEFAGLIWVLEGFVKCLENLTAEQIMAGAGLISGVFLAMAASLVLLSNAFKQMPLGAFAEMIVLIAAMAGIIWVITEFAKALKDVSSEQLLAGLALLAGTIIVLAAAVGILAAVFTAVVTTGIGAIAIVLLAVILGVLVAIIYAMAEFVRALGEAGAGIKLILEGISLVIESIMTGIVSVIQTIGDVLIGIITAIADGINTIVTGIATAIATVVQAIADGIMTVLQPIMDFMDSVIGKVIDLAKTIVQEIGKTIRDVVKTVGDVILGIIDAIVNAIPKLLKSITDFCHDIGPAIENSVDAICRSITKLVNFVVSAVEYIANLVIGAINKFSVQVPDWVPGIGGTRFGFNLEKIEIPRFVPKYEQGTNYVPNDGLAYLHQGEAVVPKKYNTPYQQDNSGMSNAIDRLAQQVARISEKVEQGIPVKGQFVQRGSDLVATVEKANNRMKNNVLNNKVYAR
ncbi:MAG: hypothetical protein II393_02510 [Cytophagales bacterium]|nr:hypothetical protein [Cytophagales bacterium]